jgi:hypothetical protein
MSPQVWGIISASNSFTVRQHIKILPKQCCACPPCVKQENSYAIYAGIGQDNRAQLFRADEVSDDWNRCCCAPTHPVKMEMRQYIPSPEDLGGDTTGSNMASDMSNDWQRLTGNERAKAEREAYLATPVALTMIRDGTQFPSCCNKCVGCFACTDCCTDGMTLVAGSVAHNDTKEIGKQMIDALPPNMTIGSAKVPIGGGGFSPTLEVSEGGAAEPFAKVQGPMCFGGCSELCFDFSFPVSSFKGPDKAGDLAVITKKKPDGLAGGARELLTDSDVFTVEFTDPKLTPEQKALFLSSTLLNDYTYFEQGGGDKCGSEPNGSGGQQFYINLCNCYCYGVLCPCKLVYDPSNDGG